MGLKCGFVIVVYKLFIVKIVLEFRKTSALFICLDAILRNVRRENGGLQVFGKNIDLVIDIKNNLFFTYE